MPTKRTPISRAPIREGLDDAALVTLCVQGPDVLPAFSEFDYSPAQLITFFRANEAFLRDEARRRHLAEPWVLGACGSYVCPGVLPLRPARPPRKGQT